MRKFLLTPIILFLLFASCGTEDQNPYKMQTIKKEKISGFVQKGPFVSGTTITMNELNPQLIQTGKVFTSTIINDLGLFEVNNVELSSKFVEFTSSGFYFNEVSGEISNSPITLTSLSDISDKNFINVNVLTHLEKRRLEVLLKEGKSFAQAKNQSRNELLSIFSMTSNNNAFFEQFDISKNTEEGAILLAVSVILQGNRSVGQLTELLSRIQNDFGNNGKLDDENIINSLRTSSMDSDLKEIRKNIENRFKDLNSSSSVPAFEKQLFKFLSFREYPLNITLEGEGSVEEKIISNISGREYPYGTVVELTPKPKEGWIFDSWSGDLSGNEIPKNITLYKERNVKVKFVKKPIFKIDSNNITCVCENVKPGDKGLINGVEFEAVDNDLLRKRLSEGADLKKVCTSLVTNLAGLFGGTPAFNQEIGNWDVSNVTNMETMFYQSSFNKSIDKWNVGNVENMKYMFFDSKFNQPIGTWNVSKVTNMEGMFQTSQFNQPIADWNVSKVTNMFRMFHNSIFNQPIRSWNVSNVTNMSRMFWATQFNQSIKEWNVSKVTNMNRMFNASLFNQQIGGWDVSNVTDMEGMFWVSPFNQEIGNWKVDKVLNMDYMFWDTPFNKNISKWCVAKISSEPKDFSKNSPLNTENKPVWGTCPN